MIEDDDSWFVSLLWPSGGSGFGGCLLAVVGFVLVIGLMYVAHLNREECSEMKCPHGGKPIVTSHECVCVEKPVKQ